MFPEDGCTWRTPESEFALSRRLVFAHVARFRNETFRPFRRPCYAQYSELRSWMAGVPVRQSAIAPPLNAGVYSSGRRMTPEHSAALNYLASQVPSTRVSLRVSVMSNLKIARLAGVIVVLGAAGCADTPSSTPDRTPEWMKYAVTGSRIRRPVDRNGYPEGQTPVVNTSPSELHTVPSVTIRKK